MKDDSICKSIIEQYYGEIYRYCYVQLDFDAYAADDCTQEVFLALIKKSRRIKLSDNIRAWLYDAARKELKSYRRKKRKDLTISIASVEIPDRGGFSDPEEYAAFSSLTEEELNLLNAYYDSDFGTREQLAQEFGMTLPKLYKTVHRLREKLRKTVKK